MLKVAVRKNRSVCYWDTDLQDAFVKLVPYDDVQKGCDVTVYELVISACSLRTFTEVVLFEQVIQEARRMLAILNESLLIRQDT